MKRRMTIGLLFVLSTFIAATIAPASAQPTGTGSRFALVIGNASYPDSDEPLRQPLHDAKAMADELRRYGFEVEVGENLTKETMRRAIDDLNRRIQPGATVLVFFSGFGIQSARQTYLIPVNAQIWSEAEVRRDGMSVDAILSDLNTRGAGTKIIVLDASRRNPFERRFRGVSAGLAPVNAPRASLVMYSAAPSTVVNDSSGDNSLFVRELLKEIRSPGLTAEEVFNRTRVGVSRASRGEQVPWISTSLVDDFYFGAPPALVAAQPSAGAPSILTLTPVPSGPAAPPAPVVVDPEANARRDYETAERIGTKKALEDFVAQHKTGSYVDRARDQIAKLDSVVRPVEPPAAAVSPLVPAPKVAEPAVRPAQPTPAPVPTPAPAPVPAPAAAPAPAPSAPVIAALPDEGALKRFDEAVQKNPNDANAYYRRGQALAMRREWDRAIQDFDQVIRLNPRDYEAFNNRCWMRAIVGQLQVAIADCNEALRLRPNYVNALDSRGFVHLKIGQPGRAIADYDAALQIDPKKSSALFGRGKARLQNGDAAGGNADLAAARTIQPNIAEEFSAYGIR